MRRKIGLLIAFTLVMVMSITVLAGCGIKSIDSFIESLDKTKAITIEVNTMGEKEITKEDGTKEMVPAVVLTNLYQCDSVNIFTRYDDKINERAVETYVIKEGKTITMYTRSFSTKQLKEEDKEGIEQQNKEKDTWYKKTVTPEEYAKAIDTKKQVAQVIELDKALYDINEDGLWALKTDNKITLALDGKNLVHTEGDIVIKARTTKLYITLPSKARTAEEMPA